MVEVIQQIVVPNGLAQQGGYSVPPYTSIHLHETANPNATMQNERDFLAGHYNNAFYTHLVGFNHETGRAEAWQVAQKNQGAWDLGNYNGNANGYASIEFAHGSARTQAQFNAAYKVYIELARQLAKEACASLELDSPKAIPTSGAGYVVTHMFASINGFGSSHTDPVAYFESMGVSYSKLKQDVLNGLADDTNNNKKVVLKDMLLFKSDIDTNFGSKNNVYLADNGIVIRIDSTSTFNELRGNGVPFTTMTKINTESIINALGGVK